MTTQQKPTPQEVELKPGWLARDIARAVKAANKIRKVEARLRARIGIGEK